LTAAKARGVFFRYFLHHRAVSILVSTGPFAREIRESYRPAQAAHDLLHFGLYLARALSDRAWDRQGRIHQYVL